MNSLYGDISERQLSEYKTKLHNKMFWLLLYKDPKTKDKYDYVDFDKYFVSLMKEIHGLNTILLDRPEIVELLSMLQAAYEDADNYSVYRKFVLDAHAVLDKLTLGEVESHDHV